MFEIYISEILEKLYAYVFTCDFTVRIISQRQMPCYIFEIIVFKVVFYSRLECNIIYFYLK